MILKRISVLAEGIGKYQCDLGAYHAVVSTRYKKKGERQWIDYPLEARLIASRFVFDGAGPETEVEIREDGKTYRTTLYALVTGQAGDSPVVVYGFNSEANSCAWKYIASPTVWDGRPAVAILSLSRWRVPHSIYFGIGQVVFPKAGGIMKLWLTATEPYESLASLRDEALNIFSGLPIDFATLSKFRFAERFDELISETK